MEKYKLVYKNKIGEINILITNTIKENETTCALNDKEKVIAHVWINDSIVLKDITKQGIFGGFNSKLFITKKQLDFIKSIPSNYTYDKFKIDSLENEIKDLKNQIKDLKEDNLKINIVSNVIIKDKNNEKIFYIGSSSIVNLDKKSNTLNIITH